MAARHEQHGAAEGKESSQAEERKSDFETIIVSQQLRKAIQ